MAMRRGEHGSFGIRVNAPALGVMAGWLAFFLFGLLDVHGVDGADEGEHATWALFFAQLRHSEAEAHLSKRCALMWWLIKTHGP